MFSCLCVGAGGFIGAVCRYLLGLLPVCRSTSFPFMTMLINIGGSFLIGCIAGLAAKEGGLPANAVLFLKVGLCGGFTTFSSFSLDTLLMLESGSVLPALAYAAGTFVVCLLAVWGGQSLVRAV